MKIEEIVTQRCYENWPSFDLIYEWEDVLAKYLSCSLFYDKKTRNNRVFRHIPLLGKIILTSRPAIMFELCAMRHKINDKKNIIPWIIDFYVKGSEALDKLYKRYRKSPIVFISSREVYEYLKSVDCPFRFEHVALSISDKYNFLEESIPKKTYDLVIVGRPNKVLNDYVNKYASSHPDFLFVYRKMEGSTINYYTSHGEKLGDLMQDRKGYIDLLKKARIGLYATPGIDGGEGWTHGFNQVTPRFLEYVSCGCHVIARYPQNPDTDWYELNKFCPSIDSYELFERQMDYAMTHDVDIDFYRQYLTKHYTSVRAKQIKDILSKLK